MSDSYLPDRWLFAPLYLARGGSIETGSRHQQ